MSEEIKWGALAQQWAEYRGWKIDGIWWTHPEKGLVRLDSEPEFDKSVDALLESLPDKWEPHIQLVNGKWHVGIEIPKRIGWTGYATYRGKLARPLLLALCECMNALKDKPDAK